MPRTCQCSVVPKAKQATLNFINYPYFNHLFYIYILFGYITIIINWLKDDSVKYKSNYLKVHKIILLLIINNWTRTFFTLKSQTIVTNNTELSFTSDKPVN